MNTRATPLLLLISLSALTACSKQQQSREMDWAKAALARNPAYEILATDETAGVFTVRDTLTGTVQTVRAQDLIAAPKSGATTAPPAPSQVADAPEPEPAPAADTAPEPREENPVLAVTRPAQGDVVLQGPGFSIERGDGAQQPAPSAAAEALEGPGYSIVRAPVSAREAKNENTATANNLERRSDPIICQGDRLMRIDGETLEFTGDALIAEKGCDLFISNAHIRAGGVGIIARQARVHIVNSTIGGSRGSYEASEGAEIYVARSTFAGIGRRFDTATMNDLGGNEFQLN